MQKFRVSKLRRQQAVTSYLSKPRRVGRKWTRKTKVSTGVRKSALKGRCGSHLNTLAQPLPRQHAVETRAVEPKVRPSALKANPRAWNIRSALPKLKAVRQTKAEFYPRLGKRQRTALDATLQNVIDVYKETHPADGVQNDAILNGTIVHKKCCKESIINRGKKICELNQKQRLAFRNRMLLMGRPKQKRAPPKLNRGKKKPLKSFQKRLVELTQPRNKYTGPPPDPFAVKLEALTASCTAWVKALAKHREPRPPAPVYDFRGNEILPPQEWDIEARRRVVASERTQRLAVPKGSKKKMIDDVKADPFRVNPAALTAVCSERIAQLAQPIQR